MFLNGLCSVCRECPCCRAQFACKVNKKKRDKGKRQCFLDYIIYIGIDKQQLGIVLVAYNTCNLWIFVFLMTS